jgi:hypothetical protein
MYRIISSANRDILTVSLPIGIPFIPFCLNALAMNSSTMFIMSGDRALHSYDTHRDSVLT